MLVYQRVSYSKKTASHRCTPPHKGFGMKSETQKWMIGATQTDAGGCFFSISVRTDMDCGFSNTLKSEMVPGTISEICHHNKTSGSLISYKWTKPLHVPYSSSAPTWGFPHFRQNQELKLQLDLLKRWETQWLKFVKVVGPTLQNSADSFMMISKGIQSSG